MSENEQNLIVKNDENNEVILTFEEAKKILQLYVDQNYTITDICLKLFGSSSGYRRHQVSQFLKQQGIKIKNAIMANRDQVIDLNHAIAQKGQEIVAEQLNGIAEGIKNGELDFRKQPGKLLQISMLSDMAMNQIAKIPQADTIETVEVDQEILENGVLDRLKKRSEGRAENE